MNLRKKSLALGSTVTLAGGATGASLLAVLMAATPAGAVGTTYYVDTLTDGAENAVDCINNIVGSCSLRDAIGATNDGDTIVFASGVSGTIDIDMAEGQFEINHEILIQGPGADLLTVAASGYSRVFYLCAGPAMEFSGLTITGGVRQEGGGIYDECYDGFTLRDVVLTGNVAFAGGGGGFYSGGAVTLINTVVSGNYASSFGGGGVSGDLIMVGSTISGNTTGSNDDGGGGVYAAKSVSITSSTFDDNSTGDCGGGLYSGVDNSTITIIDSTFSNNTADNCYGGAIDIDGNGNTVVIANTTITGNSAAAGGGLSIDTGNDVSLLMNTISGNSATSTDALYSGGGIHMTGIEGAPTLTMVGTVVSGNTAAAGPADIGVGSSSTTGLFPITADNSLIGDIDSRLTITGTGNVTSTAPGLGALADNGGLTKTMALLSTSPAVDAGPSAVPTFTGNGFDQRGTGFDRVSGTKSDIGAFEVQAAPPATTTTTAPPATTTTVAPDEPVAPAFTG